MRGLTLDPDPDPLSFDLHSHTLPTVEILVGSEQVKTYGVSLGVKSNSTLESQSQIHSQKRRMYESSACCIRGL